VSKNKSPIQQSTLLFKYGDAIGESSEVAKLDGTIEWKIFQPSTLGEYVGNFARLLEFTSGQFHVHLVRDLLPDHVSAFFQNLTASGLADSTIQKYAAAIKKGDAIAKHIGWRPVEAPVLVRLEQKSPKVNSKPMPFSSEEADRIIQALEELRDRRFPAIATLQRGLGLRVREVCDLMVSDVHPDGLEVQLTGRFQAMREKTRRISALDSKTQESLREWRSNAVLSQRQRLFILNAKQSATLARDYQKAVQWASEKEQLPELKTRDLRKTFILERLDYYLASGISKAEALKRVSTEIGHGQSKYAVDVLAASISI